MNTDLMFSSKTDKWATPQWLFDALNEIHHFDVDVCADESNAKCAKYYDELKNGLAQDWQGVCWMNPPYGRTIGQWVRKACESAMTEKCSKVVCLLPARTDTKWFHDYCLPFGKIEFLNGRLKFGEAKHSAPFPSMIVVFEKGETDGIV